MENKPRGILKIAGVVRESIVDGPGLRFVVFCQGCPHNCPGCHNQGALDFNGGYECHTDRILAAIDDNPLLDGVTFSGGEPFCQAGELSTLGEEIKKRGLKIVTFTGYTYEKLIDISKDNPEIEKLLSVTDVLIDGPYKKEERELTLQFRGSRNQRIIDMDKTRSSGEVYICQEYR